MEERRKNGGTASLVRVREEEEDGVRDPKSDDTGDNCCFRVNDGSDDDLAG
ncbi:hypothetical protein DEO72_LG11g937 [Vigna unguiculata]|uniref:Uncharacterized protein n=1 Tax=Vigna unguiculata TaxID=3917 RepID=A0A4D6NN09_VIGUN|nr:hypothetical protein DEO72_LG11g937 [Vigna unguiculata]